MRDLRWWFVVFVALATASPSWAGINNVLKRCSRDQLVELNRKMAGTVLDFTNNHGKDNRLWSPSLSSKRDLYVYLPPGYDGRTAFPVMYWFHGFGQDEKNFLDILPEFDSAIRTGQMPPLIIACPDGSVTGSPSLFNAGSFYLNSSTGRYGDYVMEDVWDFLNRSFRIHEARGAHVLCGGSMGGFAAYNLGFKYRERFGVLVGIMPGLSLRYSDCHGHYFGPYDPNCVTMREHYRPHLAIGRFYGIIVLQQKRLVRPFSDVPRREVMGEIAKQNPIEMLDAYDIKPGEFAMYVGYAGRDELNLNAQAEHFIDHAKGRGIAITVQSIPDGRHRTATGVRMLPTVATFLTQYVGPYAPPIRQAVGAPIVPLEVRNGPGAVLGEPSPVRGRVATER